MKAVIIHQKKRIFGTIPPTNYELLSLFKMQYLVMKTSKIVFFWFKWNHAIYLHKA